MTAILPDISTRLAECSTQPARDGTTLALLGGIAVRLHASDGPAVAGS